MSDIRTEIAVLIHELKGQELIDALEKLSENRYSEGYNRALYELHGEWVPDCEFD